MKKRPDKPAKKATKRNKLVNKLEKNIGNDKAKWTIMIYMAGDNNLAEDFVNAMLALKKEELKTGDNIHVTIQFDPGDPRVSTRRLVINRGEKRNEVRPLVTKNLLGVLDEDRVLITQGAIKFDNNGQPPPVQVAHDAGVFEGNTADPGTLFDFISWSSENFPADCYMLILAGHSAGVEDGFLLKDEHPGEAMKLEGLKEVLTQVRENLGINLNILGMDSCLMSMVEVCLELKGLVEILVGSQSMTPNPGWPYAEIVKIMKKEEGRIEPEVLAPTMVHEYIRCYVDQAINSGTSTDLAALRIAPAELVADKVRDLAADLLASLKDADLRQAVKPALVLAHWEAQSYNGELFVDLVDFCELLTKHLSRAAAGADDKLKAAIKALTDRCTAVKEAIGAMVMEACYCGIDYQYSNGVSIYFPWSTIFFDYQKLKFAGEESANWYQFLRGYIEGTRRKPRGAEDTDSDDVEQGFILVDPDVLTRRVEPLSHGPNSLVHSMRNPPRRLPRHMIKGCAFLKDI